VRKKIVRWAGAPAMLVLAALTLGPGCSRAPQRPNIVIVVLDTVRLDHTGEGAGGAAPKSATPVLDRLAGESTTFSRAWANAPWTVPSHASIFTGLLPSSHHCTGKNYSFLTGSPTSAELLSDAGYETVAFFSNPWLTDRLTGILRGFRTKYEEAGTGTQILNVSDQGGTATLGNVASWLSTRREDAPFFLFANFLEPHLPYDPPREYREEFLADLPMDDVVGTQWAHAFNAGLHDPDDVDFGRIRRLYAGDVSTADAYLGLLVGLLKEHGLYDDTVIIVTSDHGENLGEHGFLDHQFGVFDTLIEIPLVVRAPGWLEPGSRDDAVMLTDIFATVLELGDVADPPETPHSRSLLGVPFESGRPVIAEYTGANSPLITHLTNLNPKLDTSRIEVAYSKVRVGDFVLVVGSDGSEELYDLATDPRQEVNVAAERPGVVNALFEVMPAIRRISEENLEIDEEMRERLRALGYIQ
jgi:arylsulfatase A-like enzyme